MRILLVEDDVRISEPVVIDLRRQRYLVDVADDGRAGLDFARTGAYDILLLDIMLPSIDGIAICRSLRAERCSAFILMLTARDAISDKVRSLDAGADDYLVKPFALEELSARLRALARRTPETRDVVLRFASLAVHPISARLTVGESPVPLTKTEYAMLTLFLRNPRVIFTKADLLHRLSEFDGTASEESIKVHVTNLRRKLREGGCTDNIIETIYGTGYRLADPP